MNDGKRSETNQPWKYPGQKSQEPAPSPPPPKDERDNENNKTA
jgi:hypothetical protein